MAKIDNQVINNQLIDAFKILLDLYLTNVIPDLIESRTLLG